RWPGSRVQAQPPEHLVHAVSRAVDAEADERHRVGGDGADGRAVRLVVTGLEHLLDVDGDVHAAGEGARVGLADGAGVGLVDQDGRPEHRQVGVARRVLVRFADDLREAARDGAREEGGDVQPPPGGQVVADHDSDLGVEAHGAQGGAGGAGRLERSCATLDGWSGAGTGGPPTAPWRRCTPISSGTSITATVTRRTRSASRRTGTRRSGAGAARTRAPRGWSSRSTLTTRTTATPPTSWASRTGWCTSARSSWRTCSPTSPAARPRCRC